MKNETRTFLFHTDRGFYPVYSTREALKIIPGTLRVEDPLTGETIFSVEDVVSTNRTSKRPFSANNRRKKSLWSKFLTIFK